MKIFDNDDKVNFVDDNNVFVGYELCKLCCENSAWFISDKEMDCVIDEKDDVVREAPGYNFDTKYFVEVEPKEDTYGSVLDAGGMVRFKMVADGKPDLFLHLYNIHNGYYSHGFDSNIGGVDWKSGNL